MNTITQLDATYVLLASGGLTVITLLTRSFFMLPQRELPMPQWLRRGLKYAPVAALAAVVTPQVVMTNGVLLDSLYDARLPAVVSAAAYFVWRKGILGTIVAGMAVYVPLHVGWGW